MAKRPTIGVIAAAGKGTRAYPLSQNIHKTLFEIEGKTLLHRNAEILAQQLGVQKIYVIVGHMEDQVRAEIEKMIASGFPVPIEAIPWTTKGLGADAASAMERIQEPYYLILGDEVYSHPDHQAFNALMDTHEDVQGAVGYVHTDDPSKISKNYSVVLDGDRVVDLLEKPVNPPNDLLGVGSWMLAPSYLEHFHLTPPNPRTGFVDIADVLHLVTKATGHVYGVSLNTGYHNINTVEDYDRVVREFRDARDEA
jgi:NDP-sugar pyrophosphorylase family protein